MENSELSIQMLTQHIETQTQFHIFFVADFLKNEANFIENKVSTKMMPKSHKISIFRPIWPPKPLPKPFQNLEKNVEKSTSEKMRRNEGQERPKCKKHPPKRGRNSGVGGVAGASGRGRGGN